MLSFAALAQAQDTIAKPKQPTPAGHGAPPMPPVRPADLPPSSVSGFPEQQHEPAAKEELHRDVPGEASSAALSPYQPHALPPATRAQMHACGVEWQHMKATGAATDKTWYTFAQTCLAR
jgi:hypothetical protein